MSNEVINTELHIIECAKDLFFVQGRMNATTQEIADHAKVNRTLVNYYFRSKSNLFDIVYREIITEMKSGLDEIYGSSDLFPLKVDLLIDSIIEIKAKYPFLELFNVQETGKLLQNKKSIVNPKPTKHLKCFVKEIEQAMEDGLIIKCHPINFIMMIISMISFPRIMQPIFSNVFGVSDKEYKCLLREQKMMIKQALFKS